MIKVIRILAAVLLFSSCKAQPGATHLKTNADNNTVLWEVSGNKLATPSYLFGTFHLICKDDIPFGEQFKTAVKSAKEIYMELDMDDPATMFGGLMLMNMKGDTTLKTLFTEAEYKKIETFEQCI